MKTLADLVQQAEESSRVMLLLYGEAGAGKTYTALTAPRPVLFILIGGEDELHTALGKTFRQNYPDFDAEKDLYYHVVSDEMGKRGVFSAAKAFDEAGDVVEEALKRDADPDDEFHFSTIVIDNLSRLNDAAMNKSIEFSHRRASDSSRGKSTMNAMMKHGIVAPSDSDWGGAMSLVKQFTNWLMNKCDKHIVYVCHEWIKSSVDRKTKQETMQMVKPQLIGNLRQHLPNQFSCVWRQDIEGQYHVVHTEGDGTFIAKTRMGGTLDVTIRDPNLTELFSQLLDATETVEPKKKKRGR